MHFRLDPASAELVRLGGLHEVVLHAISLQDQADAVIVDCAQPGDIPAAVAQRGRQVASEYGRLCGWAEDLRSERVGQLLRYHLEMLDVALKLAFPNYRSEKLERRRLMMTGLGAPRQALRDVEAVLRAHIADLENT